MVPLPPSVRQFAGLVLITVALSGCGKDSYVTEPEGLNAAVQFGEGVEIITPADTVIRFFDEFTPTTYQGRPAILLEDLVGEDLVEFPDLYGYRLVGVDGYYPNQPGKEYGDNTWDQLAVGYLDLRDIGVLFETEQDPALRKGHNVKWLIRVDVLRAIDVVWPDGRKLAALSGLTRTTVPDVYPGADGEGVVLARFVDEAGPAEITPDGFLYRVLSRDGSSLPRLLTWAEMNATFYLPDEDEVVMAEALGPAYRVELPKTIRMEAGGR